MKAKLLSKAGQLDKGTAVDLVSTADTGGSRPAARQGEQVPSASPVYRVCDDRGHTEEVDTRDLQIVR